MKLLLCMTIVGASLAVGLFLHSRLNERTKILSSFITLLEEVSVRMTYTCDDLATLFCDNFADYHFEKNEPFAVQFCRMTRQFQNVLTAEDLRLLDDFTRDLGASDTASQQKHIRLYISLLSERLDTAREEVRQKGRICLILPLSVGIAAAILLI